MRKLSMLIPAIALLFACGGGSDDPPVVQNPPAQTDRVNIQAAAAPFDAAQDAEMVAKLSDYMDAYYATMVHLNSFLLADLEHMTNRPLKARFDALLAAMDDLETAGGALESFDATALAPAVAAGRAAQKAGVRKAASADQPDLYHAQRLIDLYMNDDAFYRKYSLSDISRRTRVPIKRLRMMMQQIADGLTADALNLDAEVADTIATRVETIRDTANTVNSALAIYATGGAWAAATTTVQKGVVVLQGVNQAINITDTGLTFAYGDEERPAIIEKISTTNKIVSIALGIATLDGSKLNKAVAITGAGLDGKDLFLKLTDDKNALTLSDSPEAGVKVPNQEERSAGTFTPHAGDFLLPGDYRLPKSTIQGPAVVWDTDYLDDDPAINDLDAYVDGELSKVTDVMATWDPKSENPPNTFTHAYVDPAKTTSKVVQKIIDATPAVVDPPALTVTADVLAGEAPLTVIFTAALENADPTKTYSFTWSHAEDSAGADAHDASLTHTFADPGVYEVRVVAATEGEGTITAAVSVTATVPAPWASIAGPANAVVGQQLTFTASHGNMPTAGLVFRYEYSDGAMAEHVAVNDYHRFDQAGSHTLDLTVKDGNTGVVYATATAQVIVAPAAVGGLSIDKKSHTSVDLEWSYSGNATFNIYADGVFLLSASGNSARARPLLPETRYCFTVTAVAGGLESAPSAAECTTTLSDWQDMSNEGPKIFSTAQSTCLAYGMRIPKLEELKKIRDRAAQTYWSSDSPFAGWRSVYDFATSTEGVRDSSGGDTAYFGCIY